MSLLGRNISQVFLTKKHRTQTLYGDTQNLETKTRATQLGDDSLLTPVNASATSQATQKHRNTETQNYDHNRGEHQCHLRTKRQLDCSNSQKTRQPTSTREKFLIGTRCSLVHRTPEQTTKLQVQRLRNPTSSRGHQQRLVPPHILSTLRCIQNQSKRLCSQRQQIQTRLVDKRRTNTTKTRRKLRIGHRKPPHSPLVTLHSLNPPNHSTTPTTRSLICSTEPTRTTPDHSATATKPYSTTTPNVSHQRHHRGDQWHWRNAPERRGTKRDLPYALHRR